MRLLKVVVTYPKTQDTHTYTFGTADSGNSILVGNTKRLGKHLAYCFGAENTGTTNVSVEMEINGSVFLLRREHIEGGHSVTLDRVINGALFDMARGKYAYTCLEQLTHCKLSDILKEYYISSKQFEAFNGMLSSIGAFKAYKDIVREVEDSTSSIEVKRDIIRQKAKDAVMENVPKKSATKQDIEDISTHLQTINQSINDLNNQLSELKTTRVGSKITGEILDELAKVQLQYDALNEQKGYMDSQRDRVEQNDKISQLVPKIDRVAVVGKQAKELQMERAKFTKELEWQENELSNAILQLEEKQRQTTTAVEKRSKIDIINQELNNIANLYVENKDHNEKLVKLAEQEQRLSAEKVMLRNKLASLEAKAEETKEHINNLSVPEQSIGELIESARIEVKIDEVKAQIDKITGELSIKESQIAEKESHLVVQVKKFRSVAELDVAVSPIKAKDTILQVLDSKYGKLESINESLLQKHRNLQRALEDYRYRILELEHSKSVLDNELAKALECKQEEFKREVYLNSQKVYSDDASAVFAVAVDLEDSEVSTLKQDITKRSLDRDLLIERASELEGRLAEISRQMDINSAEMATLRGEKANIKTRYNEIIANNRSEAVFNYIKALESNNGTKYLLDVQNDAVRNEAELAELKRNADALRTKLSGLQSRYRYLTDTQSQLGDLISLDGLVSGNDRMRDDLLDIGERLSMTYEQQRSISASLETCDNKLSIARAEIVELTKTVKVNQKQIELANNKARTYAGSDDLEQAISTFRFEISDVESERQMLMDSKRIIEADVFRLRLQGEKLQYSIDAKQSEADTLREEINFELSLLGMTLESVYAKGIAGDLTQIRDMVAEYDTAKASLAQRIENYYTLLASHNITSVNDSELLAQIKDLQMQLDELTAQQTELENSRIVMLEEYSSANNSKLRQAVAATHAETLSDLAEAISHNNIIKLLVSDKISSIIRQAEDILDTMIDTKYKLTVHDVKLVILMDDDMAVSYAELPVAHQFAIYLAITLACPDVDASQGRWIAIDDNLPLDGTEIVDLISRIEGMSFLCERIIVKGVL